MSASRSPNSDRIGTRVMWGLLAGIVFGTAAHGLALAWPGTLPHARWLASEVLDPFGQVFLRLLFFVVVPLVFASLCLGVVQLGRLDRLGPLAGKTFALFGLNMAIGVALALLFMNTVRPGERIDGETRDRMVAEFKPGADRLQARATEQRQQGFDLNTLVEMFMPRNIFAAVVGQSTARIGDMLPLILFALLVGAAGTLLAAEKRRNFQTSLETLGELMTTIVFWAMKLAPYAVAALIASVVIKFGWDYLKALLLFALGVLGVMALHLFGTLSLLVKFLARRPPLEFFRAIRTIIITAISTSSSSATLPTTIAVTKQNLGVSPPVAGFVLPLGATMNMSGTALYEGAVVLFAAQVFGVPMGWVDQGMLLVLAVISAVAVAGIPGGSLPIIVGLMVTFGIPPEGIALILGVDRILDMARTVVNVAADVATACILDDPKFHEAAAPPAAGA